MTRGCLPIENYAVYASNIGAECSGSNKNNERPPLCEGECHTQLNENIRPRLISFFVAHRIVPSGKRRQQCGVLVRRYKSHKGLGYGQPVLYYVESVRRTFAHILHDCVPFQWMESNCAEECEEFPIPAIPPINDEYLAAINALRVWHFGIQRKIIH